MPDAPTAALERDVKAVSRLSSVPTILRVITETTGLRFSLVARVTSDAWVACAVHDEISFGLKPGGTLDVATTFCSQVRDTHRPVVMNHASTDPQYCDHPSPKMYGFESYISVPLFLANKEYFGTLCALDPTPALVDQPKVLEMMKLFSELIGLQLEAEERQRVTSAALRDAEQSAELREQFVAVLSHDLRNPLASVIMAAELLLRRPLAEVERQSVERIRASTRRMSGMVTDLLDFARARMGAGIGVTLVDTPDLGTSLRQVIGELEQAQPERQLRVTLGPLGVVRCDPERLGQLVSNLVANALAHGIPEAPVEVRVERDTQALRISVHNRGPAMSASAQARLFQPYSRGGPGSPAGLGLGLYIVKQIADAHGGAVGVQSSEEDGTRFTFTLPL